MPSKVIKEIRSGHVRLSIWEHSDNKGTRTSITLSRLYKKDDGGKWETSESFAKTDLLDVLAVCLEANKLLRMEEREPRGKA